MIKYTKNMKVVCISNVFVSYGLLLTLNSEYTIEKVHYIFSKIYFKLVGIDKLHNSDRFKISNNEIRKAKLKKITNDQ